MNTDALSEQEHNQQSRRGLVLLVVGLAVGAVALNAMAGPPHLPADLPSWNVVVHTLQGSSVPYEAFGYILTTAAWLVWLWIAGSLVLRLLVTGAERVTERPAWVRSLHRLSDRITLPIVRRAVDGAMVAIVMVHVVGRPTPTAAAAPLQASTTYAASLAAHQNYSPLPSTVRAATEADENIVDYTVQSGDTLWTITERFYGTGHEFPRIVTANVGRWMPDGRQFTEAGVIFPGWILEIPEPSRTVEHVGGRIYYTVVAGDTLRGIAARLLGDEARWQEIFDLNRGVAQLQEGRVLTDPDLIWPGLRVTLPSTVSAESEAPPSVHLLPLTIDPGSARTNADAEEEAPAVPTTEPVSPIGRQPQSGDSETSFSPVVLGAVGLAAAAAAGAMLLARRRARRSLLEPPVPTIQSDAFVSDDFAEAEFSRLMRYRLTGGEAELAVLVAAQVDRFLQEQGIPGVSLVTARQGRNSATLTLETGLLHQASILNLASDFGQRIGAAGRASLTNDHDVAWTLSNLELARLVTLPPLSASVPSCPIALGALPHGETLYANWLAMGNTLIAGLSGGGTDVVLTSVIGALAARLSPDQLGLWTIASRRVLPDQLLTLPHQRTAYAEPDDGVRIEGMLQHLRTELLRRMRRAEQRRVQGAQPLQEEPDMVLVIGELGALTKDDDRTALELLGLHGPAHGIRLLAVATNAGALSEDLLVHFRSRLVLQTLDDDESIQLLGQPSAADLGSGDLLI